MISDLELAARVAGSDDQAAFQQVMAEPPDGGFDPTSSMDAEILLPLLMRQVSAEERACLTLAYAAGMSHPEIVEITGLPLGTVKSHISRGRQKLQHWLKEHDHSIPIAGKAGSHGPDPASEARHG